MFSEVKCIFLVMVCCFYSCKSDNSILISSSLPIDSTIYLDVYDVLSSRIVAQDTSKNRLFSLVIDSLPAGIYSCYFSWERSLLKPNELKQYARFGESDLPKYVISKTLWIDAKESNNYKISLEKSFNQESLEQFLLSNSSKGPLMKADASGDNFQLFEDFTAIKQKYVVINAHQKDSLRKVLYEVNNQGDIEQAKAITQQLSVNWMPNIQNLVIKAETDFLKKNINSKMFPYVYYSLIDTKSDFDNYKEIYDVLPPSLKVSFDNYINKLNK